jgi:hypothetical protein
VGRWGAAGVGWLPGSLALWPCPIRLRVGARAWLVVPASARARRREIFTGWVRRTPGPLVVITARVQVHARTTAGARAGGAAMQCSGLLGSSLRGSGDSGPRTHEWCVAYARAGLVRGHRGTAQLPRVNAADGSGRRLGTRERAVAAAAGTGSGSACLLYPADSVASDRGNDGREGITCFAPVAGREKKGGSSVPPGTPAVRALP